MRAIVPAQYRRHCEIASEKRLLRNSHRRSFPQASSSRKWRCARSRGRDRESMRACAEYLTEPSRQFEAAGAIHGFIWQPDDPLVDVDRQSAYPHAFRRTWRRKEDLARSIM